MSMDGTTNEVGSRPPSESGDHPSKEAHKKGRFKVSLGHTRFRLWDQKDCVHLQSIFSHVTVCDAEC